MQNAYGHTAVSLITSKDFQNDVPMRRALQQSMAPKTTKIATGGRYMKGATLDSLRQGKKEEVHRNKDLRKVPPAASIASGSDSVLLGSGSAGLAAATVTGGGAGMAILPSNNSRKYRNSLSMEPMVEHKQWLHYTTPVDQSAGNSNVVSIGQETPAAAAMVPVAQTSAAVAAVTTTAAAQPVAVAHAAAAEPPMTPRTQERFKGRKKHIRQNVFGHMNEAGARPAYQALVRSSPTVTTAIVDSIEEGSGMCTQDVADGVIMLYNS